jgi:K+-sensing histidine kinase KdpD
MDTSSNSLKQLLSTLFSVENQQVDFPSAYCDAFTHIEVEGGSPVFSLLDGIPDFLIVLRGKIHCVSNTTEFAFEQGEYFWKEEYKEFNIDTNSFVCAESAHIACIYPPKASDSKHNCANIVPLVLDFIRIGIHNLKQSQLISNQELQIEVQKKRINDLVSSRKKYMGILGHDLRSPVASMITLSEIMIDDFEEISPIEMKSMIQDLSGLAKIHHKMLENLIFWTRLQNGLISFDKEWLVYSDFMTKAWEMAKADHPLKDIKFINTIPPNKKLYADANMLLVLLKQVLSNSIKFSYNQSQVIAQHSETDQNQTIQIIDQGLGIKNDKVEVLFDPEKHNSTYGTENEMGTGVGLLLCNDIAKKHQWILNVNSEPGQGTTVSLIMPKNTQS